MVKITPKGKIRVMIELLVLIAIATIGVIYTSSTGEAESTAMAEKTAKDALNEAEGQSGIGILGIDVVARKMRDLVSKSETAVTADTLAAYRGHAVPGGGDAADEADPFGGIPREDLTDVEADELVFASVADRVARALEEDDEEDDVGLDDIDDVAASIAASVAQADELSDDLDDDDEDEMREDEMRNAFRDDLRDEEDTSLDRDWSTAVASAGRSSLRAQAAAPELDTRDAPLVEDFEPEYDQIEIAYRPGEAGNGRIGIAEDPLRPGSAAVTLGGRCVAVVLDGFGRVRAHHIDLVCDDGDDLAA